MKKSKIITLILLISLILTSCGNSSKSQKAEEENTYDKEIETAVQGFVKEMQDFNIAGFLQYTTPEKIDEEKIKNAIPQDQLFKIETDYLRENAKGITYKIEEIKQKDNKALVKIKFRYVDMSSVIHSTLQQYAEKTENQNMTEGEKDSILAELLKDEIEDSTPVYIEKIVKVDMVKIDNKWYINNLSDDLLDVMLSDYLRTFDKLSGKEG